MSQIKPPVSWWKIYPRYAGTHRRKFGTYALTFEQWLNQIPDDDELEQGYAQYLASNTGNQSPPAYSFREWQDQLGQDSNPPEQRPED